MKRRVPRRSFLRIGGAAAAALALPFSLIFARRTAKKAAGRFGPLVPDPAGILDLPAGFTYRILERAGGDMEDGYQVPGRPDGMGCFSGPDNTLILLRNHENEPADKKIGPYRAGQDAPAEAYDAASMGGVTRLVLDAATFERRSSNLVLVGTNRNCAGGVSPWGWLTCEENLDARHGYVFVCAANASRVAPPQRLSGYGRFVHEAAVVDPATNIAYLTEDRADGCFYRFKPTDPAAPFEGRLQALAVVGARKVDTSGWALGEPREIAWVDVDDPDPQDDTVRKDAQAKGAAVFRRGEGICLSQGVVYLCATSGGPAGAGQIFQLVPAEDGGTLQVIAHATDTEDLDAPDNITLAPWGELFLAEDGSRGNYLRGVTEDGQIFDFARNALSLSELAGVCFSPDGKALFVNLQEDGLTLAVTGPFPEVAAGASGSIPTGTARPGAG
ncbi:alkaline phosphatase PhoX [Sorangium sp. So ce590]|uniref:alkaline phosphatase PhoX n=1 Tax=Sorangium sp. So ce590 TaxID=3133317 RepID=UPI003F645EBD